MRLKWKKCSRLTGFLLSIILAAGSANTAFAIEPVTGITSEYEEIEAAISWAIATAADDTHGYSQANRLGDPDYDCSSFASAAFVNAGFDVPSNGITSNMRVNFTKVGFTWIPWEYIVEKENLQRGDVLLREIPNNGHAEIYIGGGQIVGAHQSRGNRYPGDQDGTEVSVTTYYNGNWTGILRYKGVMPELPVTDVNSGSASEDTGKTDTGSSTGGSQGGNTGNNNASGSTTKPSDTDSSANESDTEKQSENTSYSVLNLNGGTTGEVAGVTFSAKENGVNGKTTLYYKSTGKKKKIKSAAGLTGIILTNGSRVYYVISTVNNEKVKNKVYCYNIEKGSAEKVFTASSSYMGIDLCGYYDGMVYYIKGLDPGKLCRYNPSTSKNEGVANNVTTATQYGSYFICHPYRGDYSPSVIKVFDAAEKKTKVITKQSLSDRIIGNKLYYVEYVADVDSETKAAHPDAYIVRVVRSNLAGTKSTVLLDNVEVLGGISNISSKSIQYVTYDAATNTTKTHKIKY